MRRRDRRARLATEFDSAHFSPTAMDQCAGGVSGRSGLLEPLLALTVLIIPHAYHT